MSKVEIAKGTINDLTAVCHLMVAAKYYMTQAGIQQWTASYPNRQVIQADLQRRQLYKLVIQDTIVAVATLDKSKLASYKYTLRRVATHPQALGHGYASCLMEELIQQIKREQGKYLYAGTNFSNLNMQNLLKKYAFEKISEYTESERANLGAFYLYLKQV